MPSEQCNALLSGVVSFSSLVDQLLSADNNFRAKAEEIFYELKDHQPDFCISNLVAILRSSPSEEQRSFAAIMLRKVLMQGEPTTWQRCSATVQATVKTELLNSLQQESLKTVSKKVGDTIAELAAEVHTTWPELLPFMFSAVQSGDVARIENTLNIFACLAHYMTDALRPVLPTINQMLTACLSHASSEVQVAAMRAVSNFIQALETPNERDLFQPLLPGMLALLGSLLNQSEEASAQEVLELLIEVADEHPRFLRKNLQDVVSALISIARADQLEADTRRLAAEFMVTLCEARDKAPGMMRKLPQFIGQLFETLMHFLLDVEDDPLWHNADNDEHEEEGGGELYDFGQECLDRIAVSLGGNSIVPFAGQLLPAWLTDGDWRKRHATLICLAQIAEGCAKVMLSQLDALVAMCVRGLSDPNAKVRWSACQALGQMCTDLGPELQNRNHTTVLPALMTLMDDFNNPRVQAHASAAVVNFSENCDQEILPPYLDTLIHKLMVLLQMGKKLVQEGALTALASVADSSQTLFVKYYDHVLPLLSTILTGATDKSQRQLRAKALECISLVGMAVGRDRFRNDAAQVMGLLQQLQAQGLEADDPTVSYILQAGARLCKCLGEEFLPYLPIVMPPLIKSAQLDPDVKVRDTDEEIDEDDDDDDDVEHINLGGKLISIRTSSLEEKATACTMLCCYADELKDGFLPYVKMVSDIMVPLLKFWFHEEVRRAAVNSLPMLLRDTHLASEKGNCTREDVRTLLEQMWGPLMEAMAKEPEADIQASMLESLTEMIDLVDADMIQQPWVEAAFTRFGNILKASDKRRKEREERRKHEEFDEEELEALEEENEAEEELFDQVGAAMGAFLKKFGDAVLPYVETLMPAVAALFDKKRNAEERRIAMCVVDDLLEHSPAGRAKYAQMVLPMLLDGCSESHSDLRQCCVYGLGILGSKAPELFKPVAATAVERMLTMISQPDARSDDNEMATDNAIAALGRVLFVNADVLDVNSLASAWVNALPLKADSIEAQAMHEQLVKLVNANDARVLGPNNANVPKIVSICVEVLARGTHLVSAEAGQAMVALLHTHGAALQELVNQTLASLSAKQQTAFQTWMSGTVPKAE